MAAPITGIDHVALTVADIEATTDFYKRVFGATWLREYAPDGRVLQRTIHVGGAQLSLHLLNNGVTPIAGSPMPGAADMCFTWNDTIESAAKLLQDNGVAIEVGPAPRTTAAGLPSQSVYFRDPDGNLMELMATDPA